MLGHYLADAAAGWDGFEFVDGCVSHLCSYYNIMLLRTYITCLTALLCCGLVPNSSGVRGVDKSAGKWSYCEHSSYFVKSQVFKIAASFKGIACPAAGSQVAQLIPQLRVPRSGLHVVERQGIYGQHHAAR